MFAKRTARQEELASCLQSRQNSESIKAVIVLYRSGKMSVRLKEMD